MKRFIPAILIFCILAFNLHAQQYVEVACGNNYSQQAYYRFSDDAIVKLNNETWDIAFTAFGFQDAGIFVNESSSSSFTTPQPQVELYIAPTDNFDEVIVVDDLTERRYNDEISWQYGAFNTERDPLNPFDFGWGSYNPATNKVSGYLVFVLKLRNGQYKKLTIDSLVVTTYYVRWADLDGSNLQSLAINKMQHMSNGFAYLSIQNNSVLSTVPKDWDLFWGRYTTPLDDGQGGILEYNVTGVLSGPGVLVARAEGVDPETVDYFTGGYADELSEKLDVIGSDWKEFDFQEGWIIQEDLAFFVKARNNDLWKMVIIDFEGSATGNMTLEKTYIGEFSAIQAPDLSKEPLTFGPNPAPAGSEYFIAWTQPDAHARIQLVNAQGQIVHARPVMLHQGLNIAGVLPAGLSPGLYVLTVQSDKEMWTGPWIIH